MSFTMDTGGFMRGLQERERRQIHAMEEIGKAAALNMARNAKDHKPWEDRSHHATRSIRGRCVNEDGVIKVQLYSSLEYMVYLELAHGKKWAILYPTVEKYTDKVFKQLARAANPGGKT